MKTPRFPFILISSGTLIFGAGFAAEPSSPHSARGSHENRPEAAHPGEPLRGGKEQIGRNAVKSSQPGPLHFEAKRPLGNLPFPHSVKRPAAANSSGLMLSKMESHHQPLAKLPQNHGKIAPEPNLNHSRSASAPVMGGLTIPGAKYSTAALNGATFKHKP
jgi:hypothetical protein